MSPKHGDATTCSECGCVVIDRAQHRRWHRNIVTVKQQTIDQRRARYVGERDDDGELLPNDIADGNVSHDHDDADTEAAPPKATRGRIEATGGPRWLGAS